jgi:DNA mismatch repair protein MutH
MKIITLKVALRCEDVVSGLRTSEVWTHAVIVVSHQIVQDFGYVTVVVELLHLRASRSARTQTVVLQYGYIV